MSRHLLTQRLAKSSLHYANHSLPSCNYSSRATTRKRSHYNTLGLSPRASQSEIKSAFYRLSKKFHPDVNSTPGAHARFQEINEAYQAIGQQSARRAYDAKMGFAYHPADPRSSSGLSSRRRRPPSGAPPQATESIFRALQEQPDPSPTARNVYADYDSFYREYRNRGWQPNVSMTHGLPQKPPTLWQQPWRIKARVSWQVVASGVVFLALYMFAYAGGIDFELADLNELKRTEGKKPEHLHHPPPVAVASS